MQRLYPYRYKFVLPYLTLVILAWFLRGTGLNECTSRGLATCFGQVDFLILLLSFPGWLVWISINFLPQIIKIQLIENLIRSLNLLSVQLNTFFIPSSFLITAVILYFVGRFMEKYNIDYDLSADPEANSY